MAQASSGSWLEIIHAVLRTGGRLLSGRTFHSDVYSRPPGPKSPRPTHVEDPLREHDRCLLRLFRKLDIPGEAEMPQPRSTIHSGVSRRRCSAHVRRPQTMQHVAPHCRGASIRVMEPSMLSTIGGVLRCPSHLSLRCFGVLAPS